MADENRPLAGKAALVTGSAKRLGRAIALALAGEGVHVVVHYRSSADAAAETADAIRGLGAEAWTLQADLADPTAAEEFSPKSSPS